MYVSERKNIIEGYRYFNPFVDYHWCRWRVGLCQSGYMLPCVIYQPYVGCIYIQMVNFRESWPKICLSSARAPETELSQPGLDPQTPCTVGRYSSKELFKQLISLYIRSTINARILPALSQRFPPHYLAPPSICASQARMHDTYTDTRPKRTFAYCDLMNRQ